MYTRLKQLLLEYSERTMKLSRAQKKAKTPGIQAGKRDTPRYERLTRLLTKSMNLDYKKSKKITK